MLRRFAPLVGLVLVVQVGCTRHSPGGAVVLDQSAVSLVDGQPVLSLRLNLVKNAPGDTSKFYVQLGAAAFEKTVVTYEWPELLKANQNGATTPTSLPERGLRLDLVLPLPLRPSFESRRNDLGLVVNVFWGTDAEGTAQQAHAELSLETFYKTQVPR